MLCQTTYLALQNWKCFQGDFNVTQNIKFVFHSMWKVENSSLKKFMDCENEKMLAIHFLFFTSYERQIYYFWVTLFFSYNVLKRPVPQRRQKSSMSGKWFNRVRLLRVTLPEAILVYD